MEYKHKFDARAQLADQSILTQSGAAVSGIAGTNYEYDAAGNRTKKGGASYTANGLNQITAWTYDLDPSSQVALAEEFGSGAEGVGSALNY